MMKKKYIIILCCLLPTLAAFGADTLSVVSRSVMSMRDLREVFQQSYDNPAVKQWMMSVSYSELALSYKHDSQSEAVNPQLGDGSNIGSFDADAYIKNGTSTLWGRAYYHNGKQFNITSNETSDAELIYPYFTTDEIGGDMNIEQYYFAGGFADTRGRLTWGGTLSYLAGLYYRNIDPRPRNVTGCLDAAVGLTYRVVSDYNVGASLNFRKYKQSNDIEFVSEMGSSVIYHATGLGTHYNRFAGTGEAAYYNGYRYGATANIYPQNGSGLIASLGVSRFTFDKILTDLNHLPLCSVWHNALDMQVGYSSNKDRHTAAVALNYNFSRRHGKENIFGDASTSIYPKIGYLEMYADNRYKLGLTGLYEYHDSQNRLLSVMPNVGYTHQRQVYADPRREMLLNDVSASLDIKGAISPSEKWLVSAQVGYGYVSPLSSCDLLISEAIDSETSLISASEQYYNHFSNNQSQVSANISATRSLNKQYALQLAVDYVYSRYVGNLHENEITTTIKFIF